MLLLVCLILSATGTVGAAEAEPTDCRADQLKKAKVTALAEIKHQGSDYSKLTSTLDVGVPAEWAHASDLLLDTHSPDYRSALRCLVDKPLRDPNDFRDNEWRFKPVTAKADGKWVKVHYQAVNWVQYEQLVTFGPWTLTVEKDGWRLALRPSPTLEGATWESVHVSLGGLGALTASPPPRFGEGGTKLSWMHKQPAEHLTVTFRPPAVQQWSFITTSTDDTWQAWETWGSFSASGAFWYVAAGALLLLAGRRLRRSLIGKPKPQESKALNVMRWWAILLMLLGLLIYLGDNLYRLLARLMDWKGNYEPTVAVFTLAFLGLVLCLFGGVSKHYRVGVCVLIVSLTGWYFVAEVLDFTLLPTADQTLSPLGYWTGAMACVALTAVCWLGLIAGGQRVLLMGETRLSAWVMVCAAVAAAMMTVLWGYLAFKRDWERVSWLADPRWHDYEASWESSFDEWWWNFPANALEPMLFFVSILAPLVVLGVLRVCRVEQYEKEAFTPGSAEKFLLVVLFAVTLAPYTLFYGFSGYALTLLLCLGAAWGVLAVGSSTSVLEKSVADSAPLGRVISRTERADVLRLARRFRELQARLHHLGTVDPAERSAVQESIEVEIDRLDQSLPQGVRPADLPFACGPMPTWWGNACRGAVNAGLVGLPVTGLVYWISAVKDESWVLNTLDPAGLLWITQEILLWQVAWIVGGFFLGALWRDLPGRHGPTKAIFVALAFAVPAAADFVIAQALGGYVPWAVGSIAAFGSVMTCTGLVMDLQTFQDERRYWPTHASFVAYVYRMRFASVAFFLAQLLALATIWKTFTEGGQTPSP
ncbi:hypothetical protein HYE82_32315 [Streptomyces sp. BR123]|uniref:DUF6185 family protein n=1 Tax=Streptomyces sp. BR123 TaxID=2749828 RepID=UPI0015C45E30|nr:DUF6185 family protein [Streptomyces sp. BR123]NXY98985.1 hypothetical protein [Streptomyces sp. BR123]